MFTTIQRIRERAGLQMYKVDSKLLATGSSLVWFNGAKDIEKFVPRQGDGATVASVLDVTVKYNGLSVGISAIDSVTGNITMATGYTSGSSLVATYTTSPLTNQQVFDYMSEANSLVSGYIGQRYNLPLGVCVPMLSDLETRVASANILISSYGVSGRNSAEDGFALKEEVMGVLEMIRTGQLPLVDVSGNVVDVESGNLVGSGGALGGQATRVKGVLFTTDQEEFTVTDPN